MQYPKEMMNSNTPDVSIVIPLYNEEESIPRLHVELEAALTKLDRSYEILIVDDGSSDNSLSLLREIAERDPLLRVISLRRNFGQTAAFSAGFDYALGDVIITMDADLQNDPADISLLLNKMDEGYDIVSGWRKDRKDRFLDRRLPSILANRLISNVTDVNLHDYGCSLKAYRRDALQQVRLYGEMHRFIPALVSQVGARVAEVPVNHRSREFGSSKYGIGRTVRVVLDLLTVWFLGSYGTRPIHVFGGFGLSATGLGIALGIYLSFVKIILGQDIGNRPLLLLAVLLVMVGAQLITMGLIAEMIIRTYHESQHKPIYSVREVLAGEPEQEVVPALEMV
ncbi:MAG: glycosyltransferase family 2 protein [Chloroflexota bacterium]